MDGTLAPAEKRAEVERHLAGCPACAELARDSAAAVAFMERAAEVEPPPELITQDSVRCAVAQGEDAGRGARSWLGAAAEPDAAAAFAMGMAMTILSLSMLAQFVAPVRQLQPADLEPAEVWAAWKTARFRAWERT